MNNNTSLQRWQRAEARNLDAQFTATIIQGLNCSPFEAAAIRYFRKGWETAHQRSFASSRHSPGYGLLHHPQDGHRGQSHL